MTKQNATAKVADVPQETHAQRQARERAEQRAAREEVRKVFDADESITDLDQLAEEAGVDRSTAHNALDAPRFRALGRRAKADFKARVRAAYMKQRPDDPYQFALQFGNEAGYPQVEDALTKPQRTALANRAKRRRAREDREQEREQARERRQQGKLRDRLEAKSRKAAKVAKLPEGARPSKVASKDGSRPLLAGARITRIGRGERARWVLDVTDSYRLARFPLQVGGDAGLKNGQLLSAEALAAVEKVGGFRVKGSIVQPVPVSVNRKSAPYATNREGRYERMKGYPDSWVEWTVGQAASGYEVLREREVGKYPDLKQITPKAPPKTKRIEVSVDPSLLSQLADAINSASKAHGVTLVIDTRKTAKTDAGRVVTGPVLVEPHGHDQAKGIVALQMPMRDPV